jgi:hypothetical protein
MLIDSDRRSSKRIFPGWIGGRGAVLVVVDDFDIAGSFLMIEGPSTLAGCGKGRKTAPLKTRLGNKRGPLARGRGSAIDCKYVASFLSRDREGAVFDFFGACWKRVSRLHPDLVAAREGTPSGLFSASRPERSYTKRGRSPGRSRRRLSPREEHFCDLLI